MGKFFEFWMYSVLGIAMWQLIRVLFGLEVSTESVLAHLYIGITTTAVYHWYIHRENKDETTKDK